MSLKGSFIGSRWLGISLTGLAIVAGFQTTSVFAADGFLARSGGLVSGLAIRSDMTPASLNDSAVVIPVARSRTTSTSTMARQSVPARDRAASYGGGEFFANSKTVLPLLVADLQPRPATTARPMSGRSVGARPAAPWTRTPVPVVTPVPARSAGTPTSSAWADLR